MANEFIVRKGLIVYGSGSSTVLDVQGSQGQLFSITDSLTGSIFSANDISGIPVIEAFSDNTVKLGTFGAEGIIVSGSYSYVTGSFTGSLTGSLFGTASYSVQNISSSYAATASFVLNAISSSFATTASYTFNAVSSSFASTASYVNPLIQDVSVNGNLSIRQIDSYLQAAGVTQISLTGGGGAYIDLRANNTPMLRVGSSGVFVGGDTAASARLHVRGSGTTSATTALLVQNSTPTDLLTVRDDGRVRQTLPNSSFSTAFGAGALNGATGTSNSAFGSNALRDTTTGDSNMAFGTSALLTNTVGAYNIAIGRGSLQNLNNANGNSNIGIGGNVGFSYVGGGAATNFQNCVYIGRDINVGVAGANNEICIGNSVNGLGSNTTVIGNSSTTLTYLAGNVTVGTTSNPGYKLNVSGSGNFTNGLTVTGSITATSYTASSALITGDVVVGGRVTAQEFYTEFVSSSIIYESGSTKFGDTLDDTHQFTGSLEVTGSTGVQGNLTVAGTLRATVKSFLIDHPTKPGKQLQYGTLEGPEHSVYVRGRLQNDNTIILPDYWYGLIHEDSITVNLTPIGSSQNLWVNKITNEYIEIDSDSDNINCFYSVFAERKDVDKLIVEFNK